MLLSAGVAATAQHRAATRKATRFLTKINSVGAIAITMKFELQQEDAMGAKSNPGKPGGAARKSAAGAPRRRARRPVSASAEWEQTAALPDERDDEIECLRMVQGDRGRDWPRHCDEYD